MMSTLGKTWKREKCNRGHDLEHNSTGKKRECRICKSMRNQKYRARQAGVTISLKELDKGTFYG